MADANQQQQGPNQGGNQAQAGRANQAPQGAANQGDNHGANTKRKLLLKHSPKCSDRFYKVFSTNISRRLQSPSYNLYHSL